MLIKCQLSDFLENEVKCEHNKFVSDHRQLQRLDEFCFGSPINVGKCKELSVTVKYFLTLSQRQASIERAFSQNNTVISNTMKNDTIIGLRLIKDCKIANDLKVRIIEITNYMVVSTSSTCDLFWTHQTERKDVETRKTSNSSNIFLNNEFADLHLKCESWPEQVKCWKKVIKCVAEAEKKQGI